MWGYGWHIAFLFSRGWNPDSSVRDTCYRCSQRHCFMSEGAQTCTPCSPSVSWAQASGAQAAFCSPVAIHSFLRLIPPYLSSGLEYHIPSVSCLPGPFHFRNFITDHYGASERASMEKPHGTAVVFGLRCLPPFEMVTQGQSSLVGRIMALQRCPRPNLRKL